jgi:hypothetical protein
MNPCEIEETLRGHRMKRPTLPPNGVPSTQGGAQTARYQYAQLHLLQVSSRLPSTRQLCHGEQ